MMPSEQFRIEAIGYMADKALNTFRKEKFNCVLIAFKKPIGGDLDVAFSGNGESAAIIEVLRSVANRIEKGI